MINPGTYNFTIYTSKTLNLTFTWSASGSPVNLTGYSSRCFFRDVVSDAVPLISLTSSSNAGITLGGALGTIVLLATPTQTAMLVGFQSVVYDLELTDISGNVFTLVQGTCQVIESVTR